MAQYHQHQTSIEPGFFLAADNSVCYMDEYGAEYFPDPTIDPTEAVAHGLRYVRCDEGIYYYATDASGAWDCGNDFGKQSHCVTDASSGAYEDYGEPSHYVADASSVAYEDYGDPSHYAPDTSAACDYGEASHSEPYDYHYGAETTNVDPPAYYEEPKNVDHSPSMVMLQTTEDYQHHHECKQDHQEDSTARTASMESDDSGAEDIPPSERASELMTSPPPVQTRSSPEAARYESPKRSCSSKQLETKESRETSPKRSSGSKKLRHSSPREGDELEGRGSSHQQRKREKKKDEVRGGGNHATKTEASKSRKYKDKPSRSQSSRSFQTEKAQAPLGRSQTITVSESPQAQPQTDPPLARSQSTTVAENDKRTKKKPVTRTQSESAKRAAMSPTRTKRLGDLLEGEDSDGKIKRGSRSTGNREKSKRGSRSPHRAEGPKRAGRSDSDKDLLSAADGGVKPKKAGRSSSERDLLSLDDVKSKSRRPPAIARSATDGHSASKHKRGARPKLDRHASERIPRTARVRSASRRPPSESEDSISPPPRARPTPNPSLRNSRRNLLAAVDVHNLPTAEPCARLSRRNLMAGRSVSPVPPSGGSRRNLMVQPRDEDNADDAQATSSAAVSPEHSPMRGGRRGMMGRTRANRQSQRNLMRQQYSAAIARNNKSPLDLDLEEIQQEMARERQQELVQAAKVSQSEQSPDSNSEARSSFNIMESTQDLAAKSMFGLASGVVSAVTTAANVGIATTQLAAGATMMVGKTAVNTTVGAGMLAANVGLATTQVAADATMLVGKTAVNTTVGAGKLAANVGLATTQVATDAAVSSAGAVSRGLTRGTSMRAGFARSGSIRGGLGQLMANLNEKKAEADGGKKKDSSPKGGIGGMLMSSMSSFNYNPSDSDSDEDEDEEK